MTPVDSGTEALDLRVVTSGVTAEEIAAVTAVLQASLAELASGMAMDDAARVSAWQRSQRPVRSTLTAGAGQWRDFSG